MLRLSSSAVRRKRLMPWYLMIHLSQERKKGINQAKNTNSENDAAFPSDEGRNYGIDDLNLGKTANDLGDDSKSEDKSNHAYDLVIEYEQILVQRREGQMSNRKSAPAATKIMLRLSSSTVRRKRLMPWYLMIHLSQERKKG